MKYQINILLLSIFLFLFAVGCNATPNEGNTEPANNSAAEAEANNSSEEETTNTAADEASSENDPSESEAEAASEDTSTTSAEPVSVEIVYLNHPPVRDILTQIDELLASYADTVEVQRYDFDTPEGRAFADEKKIEGHTPLAIFVNGEMEHTVDGNTIRLYSFPQGEGPSIAPDGTWTLEIFKQILDSAIAS